MNIFTVSFFGHRIIEEPRVIEGRLERVIRKLLREKEYVEFLVGRDGDFDLLVSSVIRRCQRELGHENSALVWVLPYETAQLREYEEDFRAYYDEIEICGEAAGAHFKNAHRIRNRAMVNRSDLVISCIQRETGGAWQTVRYAQQQGKPWINLNTETSSPAEV